MLGVLTLPAGAGVHRYATYKAVPVQSAEVLLILIVKFMYI